MITVEYSETLAYSASLVFATLIEADVRQSWQTSLVSLRVEPAGLITPEAHVIETRKYMGYKTETTLRISAFELDRQLTLETLPDAPALQRESYQLEALSEQSCRLTYRVDAEGIPKMFEGLARKSQAKELPQNVEQLKSLLAERAARHA